MEEAVTDRLHKAVMESPIDARRAMWGNCVVAGGNTMFKGFAETLYKKLKPMEGCRVSPPSILAPRASIYATRSKAPHLSHW
jgi:actin-related protein